MMKNIFFKKIFLTLGGLLLCIHLMYATDYYVAGAATGNGSGSDKNNYLAFSGLQAKLTSHTSSIDTKLNIYFADGIYQVPNGGLYFNTTANNVTGLAVVFEAIEENPNVIFTGNGNTSPRFIRTTAGSSASNFMTLILRNLGIENFLQSGAGETEDGVYSLITVSAYTTITLENVTVDNISSRRNPLMTVRASGTFNVENSSITNVRKTNNAYAIFETGESNATINFKSTLLSDWSTDSTGSYAAMFWLENPNPILHLENVEITNVNIGKPIIGSNQSSAVISVTNSKIYGNKVAAGSLLFGGYDANSGSVSTLEINNSEIYNNIASSARPFIYLGAGNLSINNSKFSNNTGITNFIYNSGAATNISNSIFENNTGTVANPFMRWNTVGSIHGNTFNGNSTFNYILHPSGTSIRRIYNNTFSGNTLSTSYGIYLEGSGTNNPTHVFNNTLYNSGGIYISSTYNYVSNNLLMNGSVAANNSANLTSYAKRNISNGIYCETGTTTTTPIDIKYFDTNLTEYESGKPKVHALILTQGDNPILGLAGPASNLGEAEEDLIVYDQRGKKRPGNISVGAWDLPIFASEQGRYHIIYDPEEHLLTDYEIDLSSYLTSYPEGANAENITYEIVGIPGNGEIQHSGGKLAYFSPYTNEEGYPGDGIVGVYFEMKYKVSYSDNDIDYEAIVTIRIKIINISQPMGILDETTIRCFSDMQEVEFKARYKFISGSYENRTITTGDQTFTSFPNDHRHRYNGFSIPLVGDLDGDGKPEIVVLGLADNTTTDLRSTVSYIYILNGQTGKEIVKYKLPASWIIRGSKYHDSPSHIALVDADRNGKAEIIVAFGAESITNSSYRKQLASFEVNDNTFLDREGGTNADNSNKLTHKWTTTVPYDYSANGTTSSVHEFGSPIPQVVDFDADGNAEILVYNKIYSALDGSLLATLEELEPSGNYTNNTPNSAYANVGRNRLANRLASNDHHMPFSYIYDVDMDGKFDVAAGGKLYYDIDLEKKGSAPYYKVKEMPGVSDGFTSVADINGDGIPDIVVMYISSFSSYSNMEITLQVWNPGLLEKDVSGNIVPVNRTPELMAQLVIPYQMKADYGTLSYIYIGDVDGRKDIYGNKHPEITILGGYLFRRGGTAYTVPVHPNVQAEMAGYLTNGTMGSDVTTRAWGVMASFTWDETANNISDRLKVSFIMEHEDQSLNTGFTLFDFNNDGIQQICYRDEYQTRIVSAARKPYVKVGDEDDDFSSPRSTLFSYTGYEYPIVVDVDGDGSADMLSLVHNRSTKAYSIGYVATIESSNGDFAPAPMVWNQFMYHPLKINEDLTTPYRNLHPLSDELAFIKEEDKDTGIKTHIYNNTITQVVKSALFPDINSNGDSIEVIRPIVPIPDARLDSAYMENNYIVLTVSNRGDATLNGQTPLRIYREKIQAFSSSTNEGLYVSRTLGRDIFPNNADTIRIALRGVDDQYSMYHIRITDPSYEQNGVFYDLFNNSNTPKQYEDCYWPDNVIRAGDFIANDDVSTALQYSTIIIDVLDNDIFPNECAIQTLTINDIRTLKGSGADNPDNLQGDFGKIEIEDNKIKFTAPGKYTDGVVTFWYKVYCGVSAEKEGQVFVYIVQNRTAGFAVCHNSEYEVDLFEYPYITDGAGNTIDKTEFEWFDIDKISLGQNNSPGTLYNLVSDTTFYVKPLRVPDPYASLNFDTVALIIRALPDNDPMMKVRWKGGIGDNDWNNPGNWVEVESNTGNEVVVRWAPTKCMDVEIPRGAPSYPELFMPSYAAKVDMKDRAMLTNTHYLDYDSASVEVKFNLSERDRWVMYSAPLRKMYTGDYAIRNERDSILYKSVYMNFFQSKNPDDPESIAQEHVFTKSFGSLETPLGLGKAFNVWIDTDVAPSSAPFSFPSPVNQYEYWVHNGYGQWVKDSVTSILSREEVINYVETRVNGRFIVEEAENRSLTDGQFTLKPADDTADFDMIMVTNPFMAYLDIVKFLEANSSVLQQGFKIWSGHEDDGFVSYQYIVALEDTLLIVDNSAPLDDLSTVRYVPPLQSFMVSKNLSSTGGKVSLTYNPETMTTTRPDNLPGEYELRSSVGNDIPGLLTIHASFNGHVNSTSVLNLPGASNGYDDNDSRKLFHEIGEVDKIKTYLSVYTSTPRNEPLAINVSGDFTQEIPVGLRLKGEGSVTFDFTGIHKFGYEVFFRDGDEIIRLEDNSTYTARVSKPDNKFYEINNRFALKFGKSTGIEKELVENENITIRIIENKVYISSPATMKSLEIFSLLGKLVHREIKDSNSYVAELIKGEVYILKIKKQNETETKKIIIR